MHGGFFIKSLVANISLILLVLVTACTTTNNVIVNKGIIRNKTTVEISNVNLSHLPTRATLGLSGILPMTNAELGIPTSPLLADKAVLSWYELNRQHQVTLDLNSIKPLVKKGKRTLIYTIYPGGKATVHLD
jgi:hypothetical protein